MLGLYAFFYGSLHFLTWFWLDKNFDLHEIAQDVVKRRFITVGFLGLLMMLPLAVTSTKGWVQRLGVRRWQWLHRLVYAAAIAGVVHYYWLVKSDVRLPALYGVIVAILLASRLPGLSGSPAKKTLSLKLSGIRRETEDTVTLTFPLSHSLGAKPGQFLTFDWVVDGRKFPRSYSLSSSPSRNDFAEVTVKQSGIVSSFLNREAKVGLMVEAHGPFGRFCFDETLHVNIALFAAGSGITPIMSMLRYIEEAAPNTEITLFYAVHTENDVIFQKDLEGLQKRLPRFRLHMVVSRPGSDWRGLRGHVSRTIIEEQLAVIGHQTFFLCGPTAFMLSVNEILMSLGVATEQIRQERFTIGVAPSTNTVAKCSVEFVKTGAKHEGSSSESLLMLAERHGINIPYDCRVGQCGTCATRVLDGEVEMEVEDGLEPELRAQGYRLMCVGRATGSLRLDA